ncbi:hypothetical protein SAY87_029767 [Trapa incisa]|uniref:Centromere protein S n=2 Tax=Trapa TaxID=22665 RepID=A0AAN7QJK0_TRANT|nr:hypothetical protein SAY87_029767 [Trapa incisa]KAK4769609.1 hypothetical protein SAY86_027759 [Trapa natans]
MEEREDQEVSNLLRDRIRLATASIAEAEAKRIEMDIPETISICIADLAFKYAEHLAKDLQLFSWHARRKIVRMDDVIISAHRNENLAASLRSFSDSLTAAAHRSKRMRRKQIRIDDDTDSSSYLQEPVEDEVSS